MCMFCRSLFVLLAIVLSVLLYMESDYSFGEKHWKTQIGIRACPKKLFYLENRFVYKAKVARHIRICNVNFIVI